MPLGPTGAVSANLSRVPQDLRSAGSASPWRSSLQPRRSAKPAGSSTRRSGGGFGAAQLASARIRPSAASPRRTTALGAAGRDKLPVGIAGARVAGEGPEVGLLHDLIRI